VPTQLAQVVPGRPAVESSAAIPTSNATLLHLGADWDGARHPTPKRWFVVTLAGDAEITTSDGKTRRFGPGGLLSLDDTTESAVSPVQIARAPRRGWSSQEDPPC
jgi:hypothetical protein